MTFEKFYQLISESASVENDLTASSSNLVKLYHGTNSNNLKNILQNGLISNPPRRTHQIQHRGDVRSNWVYVTRNKTKAFNAALPFFQDARQYEAWGDPVLIVLEINPEQSILELEKEMENSSEKGRKFLSKYIQGIKNGNYDELTFDRIPLDNFKGIAVYEKKTKSVQVVYGSINSKTRKDMARYFNERQY